MYSWCNLFFLNTLMPERLVQQISCITFKPGPRFFCDGVLFLIQRSIFSQLNLYEEREGVDRNGERRIARTDRKRCLCLCVCAAISLSVTYSAWLSSPSIWGLQTFTDCDWQGIGYTLCDFSLHSLLTSGVSSQPPSKFEIHFLKNPPQNQVQIIWFRHK